MPSSTFFNLPEEKKKRILEAAINEFAAFSFDDASIARIIKEAEIPRGSFYQYFEDKKDIYKYTLGLVGEEKLKNIMPVIQKMNELGFFETYREFYIAGLKFALEHPKYAKIGELFIKHPNEEVNKEIYGEGMPKGYEFFRELLKKGIQRGEVDPEIDIELTAIMINELQNSTANYFLSKWTYEDQEEIMEVLDKMIHFIKYGIISRRENAYDSSK